MSGAPSSSNQTALFALGDLEVFQTALRLTSAPLMAHASRQSLRVRRCGAVRAVAADCTAKSESRTASGSSQILLQQAAETRVSRLSHILGVRIDVGIRC